MSSGRSVVDFITTKRLANIAELLLHSRCNGPGLRAVIWMQGCSIHCPGCANTLFWDFRPNKLVDPAALIQRIAAEVPDIEGITLTGGEPFDQPEASKILVTEAQKQGLSVVIYSGYTLVELRQTPGSLREAILKKVDILVDGPFIADQRGQHRVAGSANQQVHLLSARYEPALLENPSQWLQEEWILSADHQVIHTGIFVGPKKLD